MAGGLSMGIWADLCLHHAAVLRPAAPGPTPLLRLQLIVCMQMIPCVPVLVFQSMVQPSCSECTIHTSCMYQQACLSCDLCCSSLWRMQGRCMSAVHVPPVKPQHAMYYHQVLPQQY